MRNNRPVRNFRRVWLLALVAMLVTAFAPQALAAWQCEGRTCGISFWFCCCVSTDEQRDTNCGKDTVKAERPTTAALGCSTDCNCVLTLKSAESGRAVQALTPLLVVHALAALPQIPNLVEPLPTERIARATESRGPPAPKLCLATPALRGPPSLTFPFIGS